MSYIEIVDFEKDIIASYNSNTHTKEEAKERALEWFVKFELDWMRKTEIPGMIAPVSFKVADVGHRQVTMNDGKVDEYWDVVIKFECKIERYCGSRDGNVLVRVDVIDPTLKNTPRFSEIIDFTHNQTKMWMNRILPEAKYRVGCNCCYGDGPDIETRYNQEGGKFNIETWVDFDFKLEDYT